MADESGIPVVSDEEHAQNASVRRGLLRLSLANWAVAAAAWSVSAYLGITSPARIIVYTVLFVIGLVAVAVAVACYVLEKFAHRPVLAPPSDAGEELGEGSGEEPGSEPGDAVTPSA